MISKQTKSVLTLAVISAVVSTLLAACGGDSNNGGFFPVSTAAGKTTITGSVFAAPVDGANVTVRNKNGVVVAGPVRTGSDGAYSIDVADSDLSADLIISSDSGTFTDEATGIPTPAGPMAAYVTPGGTRVHINPMSTILHALVLAGKSPSAARNAFGNGFGFFPALATGPVPSTDVVTTDDATPRLHGLFAEAISRLAQTLGLLPDQQFALIAALGKDLSNGTLDGQDALGEVLISGTTKTIPAAIQKMVYQAIDSASRTAITPSYVVEYIPTTAANVGKSSFQLKIRNKSGGTDANGLTVSVKPMMHMLTMKHSAPVDSVIDSGANGIYDCIAYYSMGSIKNKVAYGYWELRVMIVNSPSAEYATFYPFVEMNMMSTDTVSKTLYSMNDVMGGMTGTMNYYLFRDGMVSAASPTFSLFISHGEPEMMIPRMNFVPVTVGATLMTAQSMTVVYNVSVQASKDNSTWFDASNSSTGHWYIPGFPGISSGQTGTVYVRMSVNGQNRYADGTASSAEFTVTAQ